MDDLVKVWLMKAFKDWAILFTKDNNKPFIAIDEVGFNVKYGEFSEAKRSKLISDIKKASTKNRQWNRIKRFFDEFYDEVSLGDLVVIGIGKAGKFYVYAIVRVIGEPYFTGTSDSSDARHRREVEILWQGEPIEMEKWGWANRLEPLDTPERLQQFIGVYSEVSHPSKGVETNE